MQNVLRATDLRLLPAPLSEVEHGDSHTWVLPLLSTVHLALTYAALSGFSVQNHVSVLSKIRTGVSLAVQCSVRALGSKNVSHGELAKEHRILGFTLTQRWGLWGLPGPCRVLSIPELHQLDTNSSLPTCWTTKTVPTHCFGTNYLAENQSQRCVWRKSVYRE